MKECFTYMFKSENGFKNLSIFYLIMFMSVLITNLAIMYSPANMFGELSPLFFVFIIMGILISAFPCGYFLSCIQNLINARQTLPEFEYKKNFIIGIKALVSFSILAILVLCVFYILGLGTAFCFKKDLTSFAFIIAVLSFLITMIVSFMLAAGFYRYAKTNELLAFVNYPALSKLIDKNVSNYFKYFIIYVILIGLTFITQNFLFYVFNFMGYFGLVFYTAILSLILFYLALVFAKIITCSIKE